MTQEEKSLLLKDLCARLPYGVRIKTSNGDGVLWSIDFIPDGAYLGVSIDSAVKEYFEYQYTKPYLRSMLSMTQEECGELRWIIAVKPLWAMFDFFYSHHIDFRDLIPKGLALEAKEGMYKTE